jgi:hypothetical protein
LHGIFTELVLLIYKENMHKTGIIISDNPKIMVNLQDVYFGIIKQCAQVGVRNINIFNMKNHLSRFDRNGKTFLEKDLHANFVQFLA